MFWDAFQFLIILLCVFVCLFAETDNIHIDGCFVLPSNLSSFCSFFVFAYLSCCHLLFFFVFVFVCLFAETDHIHIHGCFVLLRVVIFFLLLLFLVCVCLFAETDNIHIYGCFVLRPNLSSHDNQLGWLQPGDLPLLHAYISIVYIPVYISNVFVWKFIQECMLMLMCIFLFLYIFLQKFWGYSINSIRVNVFVQNSFLFSFICNIIVSCMFSLIAKLFYWQCTISRWHLQVGFVSRISKSIKMMTMMTMMKCFTYSVCHTQIKHNLVACFLWLRCLLPSITLILFWDFLFSTN